jgi:hypothetical protein
MSQIGEPVRKVEYWPLEEPVPIKRTPREEPTRVPQRTTEPAKAPQREKEPVPA